jgi:hypothetical protein
MTPEINKPTQEPVQKMELDSAVLNYLGLATIYTTLLPIDAFIDVSSESGYSGLEYHPLRWIPGISINHGRITEPDRIKSLHEGFRGERTILDSLKHPNKVLALQAYMTLPYGPTSVEELNKIQEIVGKKLDIVLYPKTNPLEEAELGRHSDFGENTYQPTRGVMEMWGVNTIDEMIQKGKELGYTGIAYDTSHARTIPNWQEHLPYLLEQGVIKEIHLAAGRTDMGYEGTVEELGDLLYGTRKTELSQMLQVIKDSGWKGRVVTEIPIGALKALTKRGVFVTLKQLIEDHRRIVDNVGDIIF